MKARTSGSTWIPELDGLRGLAALTVALTHLFPDTWLNGFSTANMAVSFFFSLSAFLMSYLLTLEEMHDGKIRIAKFYLRRVFRIWPLYVATMIFIVVLAGPAGPFRGTSHVIEHMTLEWFWNLGLVPFLLFFNLNMSGFGFGPLVFDRVPHFFGVIWSINVEEQFYAVFPFLFLLFTKSKKASYIIIVCFGALLIRTFLMYYLGPGNPHGIPFSMYYFSLSYVEIFFLGAIAGRICAHNHVQNNSVINLIKSKYFGVIFILIIPIFGYYWHFSLWSPYLWWSSGAYMIMAAIFSSLLIWVFYNRTSIAAKLLRSSPFRVLGRLSFAIYLLHLPAFAIARYLLEIYEYGQVTPSPDSWIYESLRTIAIIAVLLLLSTLAHFCVERPFLSLKESFDSIAASGRWSSPMLDALTFARARINWGWISVVGPAAVVFSMMFVPGLLQSARENYMKFESSFSSAVYLKPQPASWKIVGANTKGIPLPIVDRLNLDLVWVRDIGGWMPNTMDARLTGALLQRSVGGWVPVKPVDLPILASYSLPQSNDKSEAPLSRELVIDGHGMPVQQNHLSEPEGQFMRLLLDQESEVMRVWTSLPAMDAERWITLEANLRVPGGGTIHANIHDNIDTVRHRSTVIQFEAPADTWIKVSLRHLKDVKSESDNFGIGLVKPRSGAMLDIKDIVIFAGINY